MACENTMYDWSGIYFQNVLHASQKITTAAFVFFMTAVTLGRFCGDYVVMRFGIKKILFYSAVFISSGFLIGGSGAMRLIPANTGAPSRPTRLRMVAKHVASFGIL